MRAIIAHCAEHVRVAQEAAKESGKKIILQSPPHGLHAHGLPVLIAMFDGTKWILDCESDAALAVEAMRLGVKQIRVNDDINAKEKLRDIAQQLGVDLYTKKIEALDLGESTNPKADCLNFIMKSA